MTKLYIGNLPSDLTDDELRQFFSDKGFPVTSARLICDREGGRSRGFGFVEFGSQNDAERAVEELNGSDLKGRALLVKDASRQGPRDGRSHSLRQTAPEDRAKTVIGVK
jgi:RNA recognition motif-containing protein